MPGPETEHFVVDDGEARTLRKAIAILHPDRSYINREIHREFRTRSREIEPEIAEVVQQKLDDYLAAIDLFAE
jgi:hypothetical protein